MRSLVVFAVLLAVASATSLTGKVVLSPRGNRYLVGSLIEVVGPKDYIKGALLGKGSFGEVYDVTLASKKKIPAGMTGGLVVKVIKLAEKKKSEIAQIQNEFNIQKKLGVCPGVVLAVESWQTKTDFWMVMEKMGGGELAGNPQAKPPVPPVSAAGDVNEFVKLAKQMVAALKCVHTHGFVHRDVKQENWLVSTDRKTVKLADFGSSFDAEHATKLLTSPLLPTLSFWDPLLAPHCTNDFSAPSAFGPAPNFDELAVNTFTFTRRKSFDSYALGLTLLALYYGDRTHDAVAALKGSALKGVYDDVYTEVAKWKSETPTAVEARFTAYDTAKKFKPMPDSIRTFILDYLFERRTAEETDLARMPFVAWTVASGKWVPQRPAGGPPQ